MDTRRGNSASDLKKCLNCCCKCKKNPLVLNFSFSVADLRSCWYLTSITRVAVQDVMPELRVYRPV